MLTCLGSAIAPAWLQKVTWNERRFSATPAQPGGRATSMRRSCSLHDSGAAEQSRSAPTPSRAVPMMRLELPSRPGEGAPHGASPTEASFARRVHRVCDCPAMSAVDVDEANSVTPGRLAQEDHRAWGPFSAGAGRSRVLAGARRAQELRLARLLLRLPELNPERHPGRGTLDDDPERDLGLAGHQPTLSKWAHRRTTTRLCSGYSQASPTPS
jgi:hypothetical protein